MAYVPRSCQASSARHSRVPTAPHLRRSRIAMCYSDALAPLCCRSVAGEATMNELAPVTPNKQGLWQSAPEPDKHIVLTFDPDYWHTQCDHIPHPALGEK